MGAGQGKERDNAAPLVLPPSSIQNILKAPSDDTQANTLDKSLKGFLKKYNMCGMEYRLRLAGIYTLDDLVSSDEATLSRHGFTQLMARRLFRALISYVNDLELLESQQSSQLRCHQIRASTLLKSRDNYGKRNKRRVASVKQDSIKRPSSPTTRIISVSPPRSFSPTVLGTPVSANTIDGFIPNDVDTDQMCNDPHTHSDHDDILVEENPTDPATLPNMNLNLVILRDTLLGCATSIDHHLSLPMGLNQLSHTKPVVSRGLGYRDKSLSCPCLLPSCQTYEEGNEPFEDTPNELEEIISALETQVARDVEELLVVLYSLLEVVKTECIGNISEVLRVISNVVQRHLHNTAVAEVSCRILKYLTVSLNSDDSTSAMNVVKLVLHLIGYHQFNKRCQLNGCLVVNNVFRSVRQTDIDLDSVLLVLCGSLEAYAKDETVVFAVLTAMVAVLSASVSDSSTNSSQQIQLCLEQLCTIGDTFLENVQIIQYVLSFFTLSLIDVAPLMDDNIMRSVIKLVVSAAHSHKERVEIVVCCCKTVSQVAPHKLIEDEEISRDLIDCLLEMLSLHPKSSGTQTWGSYALYQLASYNNALIPLVKNSDCLENRKNSLPHLNDEARSYVEQLVQLATL